MNLLKPVVSLYQQLSGKGRLDHQEIQFDYIFQGISAQPTILILADELRATYYLGLHFALKSLHETEHITFYTLSSEAVRRHCENYQHSVDSFITNLVTTIQPSLVIFSRYGLPHGKELLNAFRVAQIPTIYYIDDDLIDVPKALGATIQKRHGNSQVLHIRKALMGEVDLVYASTPYLQQHLNSKIPKQRFCCTTYPPYLRHLLREYDRQDKKTVTIGYMASKGHQEDLTMILPALIRILKNYPQTRFETFGTIEMPSELAPFTDRIKSHKGTGDYLQFLQKLYDLNWNIGLAPLQDTAFNRCKSVVKFIEYTSCGIPTIASNINVYNQFVSGTEILLAFSDDWYSAIQRMIEDKALRTSLIEASHSICSTKFALNVVARELVDTLNLLVKK